MPLEPVNKLRVFSNPRQGSVPTGVTDSPEEMGRPERKQKKFQNKSEFLNVLGNDLAGRIAVDATLPAVLSGDVAIGAAPPVGFAGSVSPDVILPAVAEGAPLADCVGVASPTGRADVFSLAVAEVASSADIAMAEPPAVAGVVSPAVIVEAMPSTDPVGLVDPFGTLGGKCENDCLALDDSIENCDDIIEVGGLPDVVPLVVGRDFAAATVIRGEHSSRDDQTPVNVGVLLADEDMSVEEHEAIVVGDDIIEVGSPVVGRNVTAATMIRGESNPRSD